jgi:2-oxoglutarate dehydrogenase E2 component (dihydrolipoamide succinyltransferase)
MPQMGESVVEGTVTKWLVQEGEQVSEDQPLCEISTDKVDTEIPSPGAGVIVRLLAAEGQTLPVGAALAIIESAGAPARPTAPRPAPVERTPFLSERPSQVSSVQAFQPALRPHPPGESDKRAPQPSQATASAAPSAPPRRYSPVVMRMAEERRIDLSLVPGTGFGGRVSKRDVERYLEHLHSGEPPRPPAGQQAQPVEPSVAVSPIPAATPSVFRPPVYQPREGDTVEPFSRRRKLIAEHMVYSKTHSPHVGTVAEIDLTRLVTLRESHKEAFRKREGFPLTLLPFAATAITRALKEFPRMNASMAGDSLVIRRGINLGIAMDAEEGLVVPVIKSADTFTVIGLAREIERLHGKLQDRSLSADDLAGGSFTLSNPGREGNLYGFAIINQPQVGILRMGEVKKRPVVIEVDGTEAVAVRSMMYLALSYDHRVIDGVLGNRFLYRTARIIEEADFEL